MSRIWKLQMNLDELNALMGAALCDQDRAMLLGGLVCGCNAGTLPEQCSQLVHDAFTIGYGWRKEAQDFKDLKGAAGKASAEARRIKFGTANPRTQCEQSVNTVHKIPEQAVNQSTTYNPIKITTTAKPPKTVTDMTPVPDEFLPFLEDIKSRWPRKSHDGRRVTIIPPLHIWDKIQKNRGLDEPKTVVNAALHYLDTQDGRYIIGMDNFFGKEKKYVKYLVED